MTLVSVLSLSPPFSPAGGGEANLVQLTFVEGEPVSLSFAEGRTVTLTFEREP